MESEDLINVEVHEIHNDSFRYAYVAYLLFVMISSFIGDSLVLVGTVKFQAIKIKSYLVVFIQHIAVLDILTCITYIIPQVTSIIGNRWVLGHLICRMNYTITTYLFSVNQLLTCCLAFSKVCMIKFPDHRFVRNLTSKSGQIVCLIIWLFSLSLPTLIHVLEKGNTFYFNAITGLCELKLTSRIWIIMQPLMAMIFMVAPYLLVLVSTIFLVRHLIILRRQSRQIGSRQRWQGILVVSITAASFTISTLPFYIYQSLAEPGTDNLTGFIQEDFPRIAEACYSLNIMSNFYIYCLTVRSFREFLIKAARSFTSFFTESDAIPTDGPSSRSKSRAQRSTFLFIRAFKGFFLTAAFS